MSFEDPFAPMEEPAPEPDPTPEPPKASTPPPRADFSDSNGEVTLSIKTDERYDAGLLAVKFSSVGEAHQFVKDPAGWQQLKDLVQAEQVLTAFNRSLSKAPASGSRSSGGNGGGGSKPAQADEAPEWMGSPPECAHGTKKYVTKVGNNGRWYAWGCPGTKDNQCEKGLDFRRKP